METIFLTFSILRMHNGVSKQMDGICSRQWPVKPLTVLGRLDKDTRCYFSGRVAVSWHETLFHLHTGGQAPNTVFGAVNE